MGGGQGVEGFVVDEASSLAADAREVLVWTGFAVCLCHREKDLDESRDSFGSDK